jgi:tetratricopeptide (TPR) repeat protein
MTIVNFANAWQNKAVALDKLGIDKEAVKCYDKAIGIESK